MDIKSEACRKYKQTIEKRKKNSLYTYGDWSDAADLIKKEEGSSAPYFKAINDKYKKAGEAVIRTTSHSD